jgi:RNA polymerase sigma-70 factor (ECF subfamily)
MGFVPRGPVIDNPTAKRRCEIHISATLKEFGPEAVARVTADLRRLSGDPSLEITKIDEGSVRLMVTLSDAALQKLVDLRAEGQLDQLSGWPVDAVFESNEAAPAPEPVSQKMTAGEHAVSLPVVSRTRSRSREDELTMARVAQGDRRAALAMMMEAHGEIVFAYCVRMLRSREQAEDVAQQVFFEAHRDVDKFRGESSLRTWLVSIAHHRCNDAIKSRNRRSARIDFDEQAVFSHEDPSAPPIDRLDQARLSAALEVCLQELSHEIRETVLLRFLSDMTYEDMAKELGRKADTLCVRVARALPILKRCLERKGWKPG